MKIPQIRNVKDATNSVRCVMGLLLLTVLDAMVQINPRDLVMLVTTTALLALLQQQIASPADMACFYKELLACLHALQMNLEMV